MRELKRVFFALVVSVLLVSCGFTVGYSLSGASIPPDAKSFSVAYFPNNATMVSPILSPEMTDALKEIFLRRTKLYEVSEGGDFAFEGEITNYTSTTASVTAGAQNDYSSLNRLTITVRVRFNNVIDPSASFAKNYTAFKDYDSSILLTEIEGELVPVIVDEIVTNIFQDAASNW